MFSVFGDGCSIQTNIDYQEKSRIQEENDEPKNSELCLVKFCISFSAFFIGRERFITRAGGMNFPQHSEAGLGISIKIDV